MISVSWCSFHQSCVLACRTGSWGGTGCLAPCCAASSGLSASWYEQQLKLSNISHVSLTRDLTWRSLLGPDVPRVLVGARLQAAAREGPRLCLGLQPRTPEPRWPQAPAPGHPPAAVCPAPLGAGGPGVPGVQQHWALPLSRCALCVAAEYFFFF